MNKILIILFTIFISFSSYANMMMIHTVESDGCYSTFPLRDSFENCNRCSNRIYVENSFDDGDCVLKCEDGKFSINVGCIGCENCADCDSLESFSGVPTDLCEKCSNRISTGYNLCALKECPLNSFRTENQSCKLCEDVKSAKSSEEECLKCANRLYLNGLCIQKQCPENQFRDVEGNCISCDDQGGIATSITECDKCKNRHMNNGVCLITCPENFYLSAPVDITQHLNSFTECVPCTSHRITNPDECLKCPNKKIYLDPLDDHTPLCGEKECSQDFFLDKRGYCKSCQTDEWPMTLEEECAKCPDRTMQEGHCIKCNGNCFFSKIKRKWYLYKLSKEIHQ